MGRGENTAFQAKIFRKLDLGTPGAVLGCGVSPSDDIAASGSSDNKVVLWEISSGKCIGTLEGHKAQVTTCSFSHDMLATGSQDGTIILWKYRDMKRTSRIEVHAGSIHACLISPNGQFLASASDDGTARIYSIRKGSGEFIQGPQCRVLQGHKASVNNIAFSSDSQAVVTASSDGDCKIWDTITGECLVTLEGKKSADGKAIKVLNVGFKQDGRQVIALSRQCVSIWSISKRQVAWEIEDKDGKGFQAMTCHPVSSMFLLVSMDGMLCGYNLSTKSPIFQRSSEHQGPVLTCKFSGSGQRAVTGGIDGKILIWL